ncbi:MAG: DUF29 family protein [Candidatus Tectomicrobia bacterium]|nr:DUF29 family protein [Candidatus Tectomicrobia bacterium]
MGAVTDVDLEVSTNHRKFLIRRERDDRDFDAWARQQAALLRAQDLEALDVEPLAEAVADLHQHQRIEIMCHRAVLCLHLLLWTAWPDDRDAWGRRAIAGARIVVEGFREMSPSLQGALHTLLAPTYAWTPRHASTPRPVSVTPNAGTVPYAWPARRQPRRGTRPSALLALHPCEAPGVPPPPLFTASRPLVRPPSLSSPDVRPH